MPELIDRFLYWPHTRDTIGLVGMLLLALPAFAAMHASKRVSDFEDRELGSRVDPRLRQGKEGLLKSLKERAQRWSRWHAACLYAGYGLLLASYGIGFVALG